MCLSLETSLIDGVPHPDWCGDIKDRVLQGAAAHRAFGAAVNASGRPMFLEVVAVRAVCSHFTVFGTMHSVESIHPLPAHRRLPRCHCCGAGTVVLAFLCWQCDASTETTGGAHGRVSSSWVPAKSLTTPTPGGSVKTITTAGRALRSSSRAAACSSHHIPKPGAARPRCSASPGAGPRVRAVNQPGHRCSCSGAVALQTG